MNEVTPSFRAAPNANGNVVRIPGKRTVSRTRHDVGSVNSHHTGTGGAALKDGVTSSIPISGWFKIDDAF
jgi:hypothetical protein